VCGLLADYLGINAKRNLGQERDSGTDVHVLGYTIECKRRAKVANLYDWMAQADIGTGTPAVAVRADGKEWLVTMRFDDWAKLVRESLSEIRSDVE
jgi:hypothetical protein